MDGIIGQQRSTKAFLVNMVDILMAYLRPSMGKWGANKVIDRAFACFIW